MNLAKLIGYSDGAGYMEGSDYSLKPYIVIDEITSGYTDITTVSDWYENLYKFNKDYNFMRDFAKNNFIINWNTLLESEKKKLIQHYVYPSGVTQTDIDNCFTTDEQIQNWIILAANSKESRTIRWEETRKRISFNLTTIEALNFYQDTKQFKGDFIDANLPFLILWLNNGSNSDLGIDFSLNGFAQETYFSEERRDICLDILINGNY